MSCCWLGRMVQQAWGPCQWYPHTKGLTLIVLDFGHYVVNSIRGLDLDSTSSVVVFPVKVLDWFADGHGMSEKWVYWTNPETHLLMGTRARALSGPVVCNIGCWVLSMASCNPLFGHPISVIVCHTGQLDIVWWSANNSADPLIQKGAIHVLLPYKGITNLVGEIQRENSKVLPTRVLHALDSWGCHIRPWGVEPWGVCGNWVSSQGFKVVSWTLHVFACLFRWLEVFAGVPLTWLQLQLCSMCKTS